MPVAGGLVKQERKGGPVLQEARLSRLIKKQDKGSIPSSEMVWRWQRRQNQLRLQPKDGAYRDTTWREAWTMDQYPSLSTHGPL